MKPACILPAILIAITILSQPGLGNDSEAIFRGGNLILKKSRNVAMESEDLLITSDEVRVSYIFRNMGSRDVQTHVAFPLVINIAGWEDEFEELDTAALHERIGFELTIDGASHPVASTIRRRGAKLEITYHWPQTFPSGGRVAISHRYHPQGGSVLPGPDYEGPFWGRLAGRYCIDPSLLTWTKKLGTLANEVPYILRTGANWKGPIGTFRLTIRRDSNQRVSLCLNGLEKVNDTTFVFERRNFVPARDLDILFISTAERDDEE